MTETARGRRFVVRVPLQKYNYKWGRSCCRKLPHTSRCCLMNHIMQNGTKCNMCSFVHKTCHTLHFCTLKQHVKYSVSWKTYCRNQKISCSWKLLLLSKGICNSMTNTTTQSRHVHPHESMHMAIPPAPLPPVSVVLILHRSGHQCNKATL